MRPGIRIAIAAAILLLGALFLARSLLLRSDSPRPRIDRQAEGFGLYQRLGCRRCHGNELQGSHKAPPLLALAAHYDSSGLIRYLENPDSAQTADPRLNRLDLEYSKHEMPAFPLHPKAAQTLADFLLAPSIADSANVNAGQNLRQ